MRVVTDYQLAKTLLGRFEPVFYSHLAAPFSHSDHDDLDQHVIGRRYRGLFDDNDGSFVALTKDKRTGSTLIDRDCYGAIPLFYSAVRPLVSTDLRLILDVDRPTFSASALAEYLSAAYVAAGRTIYQDVLFLMPNETMSWDGSTLKVEPKPIFPAVGHRDTEKAAHLLEAAIDNSIDDLLARYPGKMLLNLSGGADSTLLLAKIRAKSPAKDIVTTTYFHDDWRDDLDDWKYADQASAKFQSRHYLARINNETTAREHQMLLRAARNVFHTYAAAFYAQNKRAGDLDDTMPIINGSGPDESIIGTEKLTIGDLVALRPLQRNRWVDQIVTSIDYMKLPESIVAPMVRCMREGSIESRRKVATALLEAPDFVEFQRRYHTLTALQDHIQELSSVAGVLRRPIVFPYLTNDIFRIVFSTRFEVLNANGVYKSIVKDLLEKVMPREFVHRKKVGFQSPSRPYFRSQTGFGRELSRLLAKGGSALLDMECIEPGVRERLSGDLDLHARYDFLEWTVYNILLLEEARAQYA
jgi:asparagine synthetase B (glutamine-hydrolysing)